MIHIEYDLQCKFACNVDLRIHYPKLMDFLDEFGYGNVALQMDKDYVLSGVESITPEVIEAINESFKAARRGVLFIPYSDTLNVISDVPNSPKRFISDEHIFTILAESYTYPAIAAADGIRPLHVRWDISASIEWIGTRQLASIDVKQLIYDAFLQTYSADKWDACINIDMSDVADFDAPAILNFDQLYKETNDDTRFVEPIKDEDIEYIMEIVDVPEKIEMRISGHPHGDYYCVLE